MVTTDEQVTPNYPCDQRTAPTKLTIPTGTATSQAIQVGHFRTGLLSSGSGVVGPYTFTASLTKAGTYRVVQGASVTKSADNTWHAIPDIVMKAGWIKVVDSNGNVTGDQTIEVILKT